MKNLMIVIILLITYINAEDSYENSGNVYNNSTINNSTNYNYKAKYMYLLNHTFKDSAEFATRLETKQYLNNVIGIDIQSAITFTTNRYVNTLNEEETQRLKFFGFEANILYIPYTKDHLIIGARGGMGFNNFGDHLFNISFIMGGNFIQWISGFERRYLDITEEEVDNSKNLHQEYNYWIYGLNMRYKFGSLAFTWSTDNTIGGSDSFKLSFGMSFGKRSVWKSYLDD